jgi:hypothetical protein
MLLNVIQLQNGGCDDNTAAAADDNNKDVLLQKHD